MTSDRSDSPRRLWLMVALGPVVALGVGLLALAGPTPPLAPVRAPPIDLAWDDLLAGRADGDDDASRRAVVGIAAHGAIEPVPGLGPDAGDLDLVRAYDGRRVRLPGYVVPLQYDGPRVTEFLLVPFIGACIHVPPPPADQLVFVDSTAGFEGDGLFQAVEVTGILWSAADGDEGAQLINGYRLDHGYRLVADTVTAFEPVWEAVK